MMDTRKAVNEFFYERQARYKVERLNLKRDSTQPDLIGLFSIGRGPVAQLDRALRFERRGWEFKSLRVHQFHTLAIGPRPAPGRAIRGYVCIGSLRRFSSPMLA